MPGAMEGVIQEHASRPAPPTVSLCVQTLVLRSQWRPGNVLRIALKPSGLTGLFRYSLSLLFSITKLHPGLHAATIRRLDTARLGMSTHPDHGPDAFERCSQGRHTIGRQTERNNPLCVACNCKQCIPG